MIKTFFESIGVWRTVKFPESIRVNQNVRIKVDKSPLTFITRIEDIDKENIYLAGINDSELEAPFKDEPLHFYVSAGKTYYSVDTVFRKKIQQPVYLWVVAKPSRCKVYTERRRAFRMDNVLEANFRIKSELFAAKSNFALTRNLSANGISMVSSADLPSATQVQINLPSLGERFYDSEIVWKYHKQDIDKWSYGVKLLGIDENKDSDLSKYINERVRRLRWAGLD